MSQQQIAAQVSVEFGLDIVPFKDGYITTFPMDLYASEMEALRERIEQRIEEIADGRAIG